MLQYDDEFGIFTQFSSSCLDFESFSYACGSPNLGITTFLLCFIFRNAGPSIS